MTELTHFDRNGAARMVDVGAKDATVREATAVGQIRMRAATAELIARGDNKKGDVLGVARIAGIMAAKKTAELIPLCHPLALTRVDIELNLDTGNRLVECRASVASMGPTGVEMEALTAVQVTLLTVYDMCKAVDRGMVIDSVRLLEKKGGKSGHWRGE